MSIVEDSCVVEKVQVNPVESNENRSVRKFCGIEYFEWLKLISNASIPLMIAVITVLITVSQQNISQTNRERDLAEAREQRRQDLEEARQRRQEDIALAQTQREVDQNKTRLQRDFELQIANEKRQTEEKIAEQQRNLSRDQREHELEVTEKNRLSQRELDEQRLQDSILIQYQRDLSEILLNHRENSTKDFDVVSFTIQMRTRMALRLLDPQRRTIVVSTLYASNLLKKVYQQSNLAPLAFANLSSVEFGESANSIRTEILFHYEFLDIRRSDSRRTSFFNVQIESIIDTMDEVNFDESSWKYFKLNEIVVRRSTFNDVVFQDAELTEVIWENIFADRISMKNVEIWKFSSFEHFSMRNASMRNTSFISTKFKNVNSTESKFVDVSFNCGIIENAEMTRMNFQNVTFQHFLLRNVTMENCSASNVIFYRTYLVNVNFRGCRGLKFEHRNESNVYRSVTLANGDFIEKLLDKELVEPSVLTECAFWRENTFILNTIDR